MIGSGIGGLDTIDETSLILRRERPAPGQPVLHPLGADQPGQRPGLDPLRLQGPEPRGGHRLLDRRARHRRRGPADRARRRRRDGGRRRRGRDLPARHRRLRGGARAVDRLQRHARAGARGPGTRTATASSWARAPASSCSRSYEHAKRAARKIYAEVIGYGLSGDAYHITAPAEDGDGGFRAMQAALKRAGARARRHRLHQRPRHLDAAGRRDRARRGQAAVRQRRAQAVDVLDQVGDRPSAGRGRRRRGDLLASWRSATRSCRRRSISTTRRRRLRHRPGAAQGQAAPDRRGAVELLRLRRHQRRADLRRRALSAGGRGNADRAHCVPRSGACVAPAAGGPASRRDAALSSAWLFGTVSRSWCSWPSAASISPTSISSGRGRSHADTRWSSRGARSSAASATGWSGPAWSSNGLLFALGARLRWATAGRSRPASTSSPAAASRARSCADDRAAARSSRRLDRPRGADRPEIVDLVRQADGLDGRRPPPMPPEGSLLPETYSSSAATSAVRHGRAHAARHGEAAGASCGPSRAPSCR